MKLSCFIIDDEHIARKGLKEYIEDTSFLEFAGEAGNPLEGMELLMQLQPDILFLDINMPKMSGIDYLRNFNRDKEVIITTAYPQFALEGYELEVRDYLLKPITYPRFLKAVKRVYKQRVGFKEKTIKPKESHVFVRNDGKISKIVLSDILFVEAMQNYVIIHTKNRQRMIIHLSLKAMLEELPSRTFIKVHKSFIVNCYEVEELQGNRLFIGGNEIPISRELKKEVLDKLLGDNLLN